MLFAESGPMTNKPKGEVPSSKVDQMRDLLPDLVVSEISLDSSDTIIVKIKNIGRGYIKEENFSSSKKAALVELSVNNRAFKIPLANIDPARVLSRPGGEVSWNTERKTEGTKTDVLVIVDITNVIPESVESNNQLGKTFKKIAMGSSDLIISDLRKNSNDYSYYAELENRGSKDFTGEIFFEIWFKDYAHGNTWKRVVPPNLSLINSNNVSDSRLEVPAMLIRCTNINIPAYAKFYTNSQGKCSVDYLFRVSPQPSDIGVEVKVIFLTDRTDENKGNNEFIKHIRRGRINIQENFQRNNEIWMLMQDRIQKMLKNGDNFEHFS